MAMNIAEMISASTMEKMVKVSTTKKELKLNPKTIQMTEHANKRAKERFDLNPTDALKYFRGLLEKAKFIAKQTCEETGVSSLLYGIKDNNHAVCIYVGCDLNNIITVIKTKKIECAPILKPMIEKIHVDELRKAQRAESSLLKKQNLIEIEANAMIYTSKLAILKTTSKKKIEKEKEIIAEYESKLISLYSEIKAKQIIIRTVAKSMVGIL